MPNAIKQSGEGLALQVTKAARTAELVEENADGDPTRRAAVLVYAFDEILLAVDRDRVSIADRTELVASAARDTESIYRAAGASIHIAGNDYQVNLPPAEDAGFDELARNLDEQAQVDAPHPPKPGSLEIAADSDAEAAEPVVGR